VRARKRERFVSEFASRDGKREALIFLRLPLSDASRRDGSRTARDRERKRARGQARVFGACVFAQMFSHLHPTCGQGAIGSDLDPRSPPPSPECALCKFR